MEEVNMSAAMRRHDTRDKRIAALQVENERLRREVERLRESVRLLPPESFLVTYSLLYEIAYLSQGPKPEIIVRHKGSGKGKLLIRNYRAHEMKRRVDDHLYRLRYQIVRYLECGVEIPDPRKSQGKLKKPTTTP